MGKKNRLYIISYSGSKILYQFLFLVLLFNLQLVTCPLWGQVMQKKELTEADYNLWESTDIDKLSADGQWASYITVSQNQTDTLFVRNTSNTKSYFIPSGRNSIFTQDSYFYCQSGNDLNFINLKNGKKQTIHGVEEYQYLQKQNVVICLYTTSTKNKILNILSPSGKILKSIDNAVQYSVSPDGEYLLYIIFTNAKYTLFLKDLKNINLEKWIISSSANQLTRFVWSKNSKAAAFLGASKNNTINSLFLYRTDLEKLFEFNPATETNFPENSSIIASSSNNILISDDLQRIFFHISKNATNSISNTPLEPEIWNVNDKLVYSFKNIGGRKLEPAKVAMWRPMSGEFSLLTSNEFPKIILSGNQQYALLSNPLDYEPQFDYQGPRDYYLLNLTTMNKRKILNKASSSYSEIIPSPDGRYIAYFQDNNWWTYNILQDIHTNITGNMNVAFSGKVGTLTNISGFGNPGWSSDNTEILLYDQYDIWALKPDGSGSRRITHGREKQIRYRIGDNPDNNRLYFIYDGITAASYNLDKQLILNARGNDGKTGYFLWKNKSIEKKIVYEDSYIDQLNYSANKEKIIYRRQKFNLSPQLIFRDGKSKENTFMQSNPQHENYHWGKSELINFENSNHQKLKGVLYYPADYNAEKKYPMIVHIYEIQSGSLHQYYIPSMYNATGFNPAVFTSKGYFVFLPDILHEVENVGPSSLDCVTAGTQKVISLGIIDPTKIGLMGHSFGGYETTFIINHSNLFKTAIASGSVTDLTSFFLTIGWRTGRPDMWRFHSEQWKMNNKTPFGDPEDFNRNSPLASIMNLQIPLLLWCGKEDLQVDWHQSIEYYLAMRRLGKKGIMLLYPQEGHILTKPFNQEDVTRRVLQWFAYFLKEEKNSEWISNGIK